MVSLVDLPTNVICHVLLYLSAPDILKFLCINRSIHESIGGGGSSSSRICKEEEDDEEGDAKSKSNDNYMLWKLLLQRDTSSSTASTTDGGAAKYYYSCMTKDNKNSPYWYSDKTKTNEDDDKGDHHLRQVYLTNVRASYLPCVQWYPLLPFENEDDENRYLSPREGHIACILGTNETRKLCINGGFIKDDAVYVLHLPTNTTPTTTSWKWNKILANVKQQQEKRTTTDGTNSSSPTSTSNSSCSSFHSFAYGSTLTTLSSTKAIRFGGFTSGGYKNECNQLALLTIQEDRQPPKPLPAPLQKEVEQDEVEQQHQQKFPPQLVGEWEVITTTNQAYAAVGRAYHTSTLLVGRYLLIIGGMQSDQSILNEAMLDTYTWTWITQPISTSSVVATDPNYYMGCNATSSGTSSHGLSTRRQQQDAAATTCQTPNKPSERHGHSVVLDAKRNRLVLFGGGNGSDLLRSGVDNSEVWELSMGNNDNWKTDLIGSLPWKWKKLHDDVVETYRSNHEGRGAATTNKGNNKKNRWKEPSSSVPSSKRPPSCPTRSGIPKSPKLSQVEALCLGRCHNAIQVSDDTAIFVFGSGRPPTNGIIAFNLQNDTFFRPNVLGPLPKPRHAGIALYLQEEKVIFCSGGYTVTDGQAVSDTSILDLAPAGGSLLLHHHHHRQRSTTSTIFDKLPIDKEFQSFQPTTTEDARNDSYFGSGSMHSSLVQSFCIYH